MSEEIIEQTDHVRKYENATVTDLLNGVIKIEHPNLHSAGVEKSVLHESLVNESLNNLEGRLLTLIEAVIPEASGSQLDAIKDQIRKEFGQTFVDVSPVGKATKVFKLTDSV